MKITNFTINLYKSIKEPLQFSPQLVNILIGQNNCGKSNILYAIDYLFDVRGVSNVLAYFKADIKVELEFTQEEKNQWSLPDIKATLSLQNEQRKLIFPQKTINYQGSLRNFLAKKIKHLNYEAFNDLTNLDKDWQSFLKYPKAVKLFTANLNKHFPKIKLSNDALELDYDKAAIKEGKRNATIDHLGSGFRRVFATLLYIFHPEYELVIIDEPETHLHPVMVKKLLWAMQNSQFGQVFFTTHSPLFINSVTLNQLLRVIKDDKSTRAFGLPMQKQRYSYQRLMQELDADNTEMLFADTVILVEGVSDRILLRALIDRFYTGDKDVKVVQTHGKGNVGLYIDLLKIFKINYLVLLDKDILTYQLDNVLQHLEIKLKSRGFTQMIAELKSYHIFVLPSGAIESHYPKKYQTNDSKPLNAINAGSLITDYDFASNTMAPLREIIDNI